MEKDNVKSKIKEAIDLVEDVEEPYRISAFEIVLQSLLLEQDRPTFPFSTQEELHKEEDLIDFTRRKNPGTHKERILTFGYFLEKFKKFQSFNASDIRRTYDASRITQPSNVNDLLNKLQGEGLLIESDAREGLKAFKLSLSGLDCVEKLPQSSG